MAPAALPPVPDAVLGYAFGPLRLLTLQPGVASALLNATFWSPWLYRSATPILATGQRHARCVARLRRWRPRICSLSDVYVAGAAQVPFNGSSFFGSAERVAVALSPRSVSAVQANLRHAVLTQNKFGAGYYNFLFDTLASLGLLWPAVSSKDSSAKVVLNACSTGVEHNAAGRARRAVAPSLGSPCPPKQYATALLEALGVRPERV